MAKSNYYNFTRDELLLIKAFIGAPLSTNEALNITSSGFPKRAVEKSILEKINKIEKEVK